MNKELLSIFGNNRGYNIESVNQLLVTFVTINSQLPDNLRREFFTKVDKIWGTDSIRKTFLYLCNHRAATQFMISKGTNLSIMSVSRAVNYLKKEKLIVEATKVRMAYSKGGPRPSVWAVINYDPEDVKEACEKHARINTPAFSEANRITQFILDEFLALKPEWLKKQIQYRDIIKIIRENSTNYQFSDMAQIVSEQLQVQHGVKIWR
ncbi:MAG: hypothetical protein ACFFDT_38645 [Candidatus Hodarchaeota archaeon]